MKYVLSCSFGRDSLAMLLKVLELGYPLDGVLYVELGPEFECVKENARRMAKILEEKNVPFRILEPEIPFETMMLEYPVNKRDGSIQTGYKWCGGRCRWGTAMKRDLLNGAYRKAYGNESIVEYVGIAADETWRINRERNGNRVKIYPLVEWGMTPDDCYRYCLERGWSWKEKGKDDRDYELYELLDRVSCRTCRNKNLSELRNMYHFLPDTWKELKNLQDRIDMPYKKDMTVHDLEERFIEEDRQLSIFDVAG